MVLTIISISGIKINMSQEKEKYYERKKRRPNYGLRQTMAVIAIGLASAGLYYGGGKIVQAAEGEHVPMSPHEYAERIGGYVDENADFVTIDEGGKIRSMPAVSEDSAGTTNLLDVADEKLKIKVDDVIISHDQNGDWITLATEAAKKVDPELDIKGDYISINTQRASVHHDDSGGLVNE